MVLLIDNQKNHAKRKHCSYRRSSTGRADRINSLDVMRGISLLGILLMNIVGFGLYNAYMDPTINGGVRGWNLYAWLTTSMFLRVPCGPCFQCCLGWALFYSLPKPMWEVVPRWWIFFRRLWWLFYLALSTATYCSGMGKFCMLMPSLVCLPLVFGICSPRS